MICWTSARLTYKSTLALSYCAIRLWRVMARMGFGLSVAPKFMNMIVQCVTRSLPDVDDLIVPKVQIPTVEDQLQRFGLPTKPAESLPSARVLGLQLISEEVVIQWHRTYPKNLDLPTPELLTKRVLFQWRGRLTSHYPVASWLRVHCSWLKRLACKEGMEWDNHLSQDLYNR